MTVARMLSEMSSREFSEWMAYYTLEPFGEELADARNATSIAANVNATIAAAGGRSRVKPEDYLVMPRDDAPEDDEALYQKFRSNPLFNANTGP